MKEVVSHTKEVANLIEELNGLSILTRGQRLSVEETVEFLDFSIEEMRTIVLNMKMHMAFAEFISKCV